MEPSEYLKAQEHNRKQEAEKQRRQDEQEERRKAHAEKLASESSFLNIFGKRPEAPDADRKSA